MAFDAAMLIDLGAFGLVAVLVVRWFGRLENAIDRLASAITNQQEGQHRIVRVLTLLAAALRSTAQHRDELVVQALEELERRKETHE